MDHSEKPIIYRLRLAGDGSFCGRLEEGAAKQYLAGNDWSGVTSGTYYISAARPDPEAPECRVVGFDEHGPLCVHPELGEVRIYEPSCCTEAAFKLLYRPSDDTRGARLPKLYSVIVCDREGFPVFKDNAISLSRIRQTLGEDADDIVSQGREQPSGTSDAASYREAPVAWSGRRDVERPERTNRFLRGDRRPPSRSPSAAPGGLLR